MIPHKMKTEYDDIHIKSVKFVTDAQKYLCFTSTNKCLDFNLVTNTITITIDNVAHFVV